MNWADVLFLFILLLANSVFFYLTGRKNGNRKKKEAELNGFALSTRLFHYHLSILSPAQITNFLESANYPYEEIVAALDFKNRLPKPHLKSLKRNTRETAMLLLSLEKYGIDPEYIVGIEDER